MTASDSFLADSQWDEWRRALPAEDHQDADLLVKAASSEDVEHLLVELLRSRA